MTKKKIEENRITVRKFGCECRKAKHINIFTCLGTLAGPAPKFITCFEDGAISADCALY
jgi:hypothetical protein